MRVVALFTELVQRLGSGGNSCSRELQGANRKGFAGGVCGIFDIFWYPATKEKSVSGGKRGLAVLPVLSQIQTAARESVDITSFARTA